MRKLFYILIIIVFSGCETEEQKKQKAKEVVQALISNIRIDNYESIYEYYPSFRDFTGKYWKYNSIEITSSMLKDDGSVEIFANAGSGKQLFFKLEKVNGDYKVQNSKGLSGYYDSSLYKYCKNIGCIGVSDHDADISIICKENVDDFNYLVNNIKNKIESKTRLETHAVAKKNGGFGSYYAFGNITVKNYSRFTIPGNSYKIYVNYLDSNDNVLFTGDESSGNFEDIGFNQSKTIHVMQDISSKFRKVNIELKLVNTKFIENLIAEHAEGSFCNYDNNL